MPQPTITNCYDPAADRPKLDAESVFLYRPAAEWTYSHHASITHFGGRFFAIWSNGREHEDDVGQRILIASSSDFATWTQPRALAGPLPGRHSELVLTAAGFHRHGAQLVAYFGRYEYRPEALVDGRRTPGDQHHMDTGLGAMTTTDGEHWSGPIDMGIPIVPNHGPQPTASGRLIISGNVSLPYTDDPTGLAGWRMTGIYPAGLAGQFADDSEGFWLVRDRAGWPEALCEVSFWQTDDGVLHALFRSATEWLWQSESADDGATWSPPRRSDFTDNVTKFHLGRLPDGRFFYVGCPDPEPRWARRPLVLSISEDGYRFDRHWILGDGQYDQHRPGLHKGGEYGYPTALVHEGELYVIVSRRKEAVEVIRTAIP